MVAVAKPQRRIVAEPFGLALFDGTECVRRFVSLKSRDLADQWADDKLTLDQFIERDRQERRMDNHGFKGRSKREQDEIDRAAAWEE